MNTAAGNNLSKVLVKATSKNDGKVYPIPPRRTQKFTKFRSKSSSVLYPLEENEGSSVSGGAQAPSTSVMKRPLGLQHSNPEMGRGRVKPPRPPPPVRQVPPRTFTQMDMPHLPRGSDGKKSASSSTVVIDTRARRRRHSDSPQPKRPPLPYEAFIPQPLNGQNESKPNVAFEANVAQPYEERTTTTPADYEVFATTSGHLSNSSSLSDNSEDETSTGTAEAEAAANSKQPSKKNAQICSSVDLSKKHFYVRKDKQNVTSKYGFTKQRDRVGHTQEEEESEELVSRSKVDLTRNDKVKSDNEKGSVWYIVTILNTLKTCYLLVEYVHTCQVTTPTQTTYTCTLKIGYLAS